MKQFMKRESVELTTEFLTEQMNHWMLFPLAMTVMGLSAEYTGCTKPDFGMWLLAGLLPFLLFWARIKSGNFAVFLGIHAAAAALAFVIPASDVCSRVLCILCTAVHLIQSFYLRLKGNSLCAQPFHPAVAAGLSGAAVVLLHYQGDCAWDNYYIFLLIGVFALYFVIYFFKQYLNFLALNKSSTGYLPAGEMLCSGLALVLGYTLFSVVVMVLASHLTWLEGLAETLKQALFALLRAFFSLFKEESGQQQITPTESAPPMLSWDTELLPAEEETFWLWKVLEILLVLALVCGLIYGGIRLLIRLMRFIRERFAQGPFRKKEDKDDANDCDIREKCEAAKEGRDNRKNPFTFLSPQARIRKLYKKRLLASGLTTSGSNQRLGLFTARESEAKLQLEGMAGIYEKARYSDKKITNEDVRDMKNVCK